MKKRILLFATLVFFIFALSLTGYATQTETKGADFNLTLTLSDAKMGNVSVQVGDKTLLGPVYAIAAGDTVTLTATAEKGYEFASWSSDDGSLSLNEDDIGKGTLTFQMPQKNVNVKASFKEESQYTLKIEKDTAYGESYIVSGKNTFKKGEEVKVDATAYDGFRFVGWTANFDLTDEQKTNPKLVFQMPEKNAVLSMKFEPIVYYFDLAVKGKGEVEVMDKKKNAAGKYECTVGEEIVLSATPEEDFHFVKWVGINGAEFSEYDQTETTLTCPASDFTVTAEFASSVMDLTVQSTEGGSVSPEEGVIRVGVEESVSLTAVPELGFTFARWECSSPLGKFEDEKDPSTSFIMPGEACTVTAVFVKGGYRLTLASSAGGKVEEEKTKEGVYEMGTKITLKATPLEGYVFARWECAINGVVVQPDSAETEVIVPGRDVEITAIFVLKTVVGDVSVVPQTPSEPFPWGALVVVFLLSAVAIVLIVIRERFNLSYRYLIRKKISQWKEKLTEKKNADSQNRE